MADAPAPTTIAIDVYSDIICPWCYIGHRRLATALAALPAETAVRVTFRPFQLDPGAPEVAEPLHARLARKFGARAGSVLAQVTQQAEAEGLDMRWDRAQSVNTRTAHRLLEWVRRTHGTAAQLQVLDALFRLYFTDGGNVADLDQLAAAAGRAGLDTDAVRTYLASDDGLEALEAAFAQARRLGVEAVPTFVIDGRYAIQGAQPAAVMLDAIQRTTAG